MLVSAVNMNQNSGVSFASGKGAMIKKLEDAGVRVPRNADKGTLRILRDRLAKTREAEATEKARLASRSTGRKILDFTKEVAVEWFDQVRNMPPGHGPNGRWG